MCFVWFNMRRLVRVRAEQRLGDMMEVGKEDRAGQKIKGWPKSRGLQAQPGGMREQRRCR
jgi:hypothetical protein